jgi:hypothetical protein
MTRTEYCEDLMDFLCENDLNQVYGVQHFPSGKNKNYHTILFCRARLLDGAIHFYSDKFIQVIINRNSQVFRSINECKEYIKTL